MAASPGVSSSLLRWYDKNRRLLPWRAKEGIAPDPYHVWLSEIMLQQTNVATVTRYFPRFLARWPSIHDLARASLDDILFEWQGLGYYSRARNLRACAQIVASEYGGDFPGDEMAGLPGIGPYTEAAIRAIAFNQPVLAMDANVERVLSRYFREPDKKALRSKGEPWVPKKRPGDFAQALMDLGAMICRTPVPRCELCPIKKGCAGYRTGDAALFPHKKKKSERPKRHVVAYWMESPKGRVAFRKRPERGLLGGMMEIPISDFCDVEIDIELARQAAPTNVTWRAVPDKVKHVFTHFALEVIVLKGRVRRESDDYQWVTPENFDKLALSSLMRKVVQAVTLFRADKRE